MTDNEKKQYKNLLKREKRNIKKITNREKRLAKQEGDKLTREEINDIKRREREKVVASILKRKLPNEYRDKNVQFTERGNILPSSEKEIKIVSQIRRDLNQIDNNNLLKRIAAILAAVGIAIGSINAIAPSKNDDKTIETEAETDLNDGIDQSSEEQETTSEVSIEDKVYEELANLSEDEAKKLFKTIYANLYEEKNGEELNPSEIEILYTYTTDPYWVTLEDGSSVIILSGNREDDQKIETTLQELGLKYMDWIDTYYYRYSYNGETIDGIMDSHIVVTLDELVSYVNGEEESLSTVASENFIEISGPMISLMSGKEISDEDRQAVANWIINLGYENLIIDEEEQENETVVSSSASAREGLLSDLKVENNPNATTAATTISNENTYDTEINLNEDKNDDGR